MSGYSMRLFAGCMPIVIFIRMPIRLCGLALEQFAAILRSMGRFIIIILLRWEYSKRCVIIREIRILRSARVYWNCSVPEILDVMRMKREKWRYVLSLITILRAEIPVVRCSMQKVSCWGLLSMEIGKRWAVILFLNRICNVALVWMCAICFLL